MRRPPSIALDEVGEVGERATDHDPLRGVGEVGELGRRQVAADDRDEPEVARRRGDDGLEIDEAVRDVDRDDAAGRQGAHRGRERLDGQQVDRHGVRRERVEHEQVERSGRHGLEVEPAVADDDIDRRRRVREEREARRVAGDLDHGRVDLRDPIRISRSAVRGDRASPEPDRAEPHRR